MTFGFILLRHVNSSITNLYWNHSIKLLKKYYPNNIIFIIDDNSNIEYLDTTEINNLKNVITIISEYNGRGELLPYIYFLRHKWFDNAIIIHDSAFIHETIDFENIIKNINNTAISLWHFRNNDSELDNILRISKHLNFYNKIEQNIMTWNDNKWTSCFGAMSLINHIFLTNLNNKYNLNNLINVIINRSDRCALERIMGILIYLETSHNKSSIFGCINNSHSQSLLCNYTFEQYIKAYNSNNIPTTVVKVWTGR
jgi:hypothetical protein